MGRLTNNQSHELALWEELVRKLRRLEELEGLGRLFAEFWGETGVSVVVPRTYDEVKSGYTIYLDPLRRPLRVTWGEGNGPHGTSPFDSTRRFLHHVIETVEDAIMWEEYEVEEQQRAMEEADRIYDAEFCPCGHGHEEHYMGDGHCVRCDCPSFGVDPETWETHTITNVGGDPGGFCIVE